MYRLNDLVDFCLCDCSSFVFNEIFRTRKEFISPYIAGLI